MTAIETGCHRDDAHSQNRLSFLAAPESVVESVSKPGISKPGQSPLPLLNLLHFSGASPDFETALQEPVPGFKEIPMNAGTPPSSPNENPATIRDSWLYQRFCSVTGISFFPWFLILYLATAASGPHPTPGSLVFAEVILVFPLLALVCGLSGKLCNWLGWTRSAIISLGIAAYAGMSFCVFPIVAIPIGLSLEQTTSLQNIVALTVFLTLCLSALAIYATCRYSQSLPARSKVPSEALAPQGTVAPTSP